MTTTLSIILAVTFPSIATIEFAYVTWLFMAQVLFAANIVSASCVCIRIYGPETGTQMFPFVQGSISLSNVILTFVVINLQA